MKLFASKGCHLKVVVFILALTICHFISGCATCPIRTVTTFLRTTPMEDVNEGSIRFVDALDRLYKYCNRKLSEKTGYGISVIVKFDEHFPEYEDFMDMTFEIHLNGLSIYDAFYELGRQAGIKVEFTERGTFYFYGYDEEGVIRIKG